MAITNAALAHQISELVSYWRARDVQFAEWLAGDANGGPYGDGRYPLTDYLGVVRYVHCPAALEAGVSNSAAAAAAQAALAGASKDAALAAAAAAEAARDLAIAYRNEARDARDLAQSYRDDAANSAASALAYRNTAVTAAQSAQAAQAAAESAQGAAEDARDAAQGHAASAAQSAADAAASAAAAATFNPALFRKVADPVPWADLSGVPVYATRWPAWDEVTGKPSSFTPSAHTHSAADITSGTLSNSRLSGVLAHQGRIGPGADLNTYTTTGIWHQESNVNATSGTNYPAAVAGMLRVYADHLMVYQEYFAYSTNATYIRKYYNGAWQPWHQVYDSGHKPSLGELGAAAVNHTHLWADITDKPTAFTPAAHTHDAADIVSGTLADARLSTNIARLNASQTITGEWTFENVPNFNAGGSAIRLKPGSVDCVLIELYARSANPNVRSGWIGYDSPGSTGMHFTNEISGGLVGIHANNGPIVLDGTTVSVNGVNVRDASILSSGTLNDARLSSNIPRLNAANTFSATQTVQVSGATALSIRRVGSSQNVNIEFRQDGATRYLGLDSSGNLRFGDAPDLNGSGVRVSLEGHTHNYLPLSGGTLTGNTEVTPGASIRFGSAQQTDGNDGKIGAGLFASGLNIVGVQTIAGEGRRVRIWGNVYIQAGHRIYAEDGTAYLKSNYPSGNVTISESAPSGGTDGDIWFQVV